MRSMAAVFMLTVAVTLMPGNAAGQGGELAFVVTDPGRIEWKPLDTGTGLTLSLSKPDGAVLETTYPVGVSPALSLAERGQTFPDGTYTWELRVAADVGAVRGDEAGGDALTYAPTPAAAVQSGYFSVLKGRMVDADAMEEEGGVRATEASDYQLDDIVHLDDVIIDGSLCVGFDCVNGESFGFDTIRLKENNLRIKFFDTSSSASFPTNDWQITANDSANGGANKFSIDDIDGGRTPFTIEATAPSHSIYVDDYGRVGFCTSTPAVELHVTDGDTPSLRLDQRGGGWAPQIWDLAGNEANFFVRDVTNASQLPFRVQPSTPTNTLCLKSSGKVGVGTWTPDYPLELETRGEDASAVMQRTDGSSAIVRAAANYANFGSLTDHPVRFTVNDVWQMRIDTDGGLVMRGGASCPNGTTWTDLSSRELKENIEDLSLQEAEQALGGLSPVKYNYKADKTDNRVGFIAEDVPDLVATPDRKGMSSMDVTAVLTKVVQDQQRIIRELESRIEALERAADQ